MVGNHEYYGSAYPKLITKLKDRAAGSNLHVLENDAFSINGVNFFGCTLWTDFELFGDPRIAGYECQTKMTDFKKIRLSPRYSKLRSIDVAVIHRQSLAWLEQQLKVNRKSVNVIVTHHAPSKASIPAGKEDDIISAAYASDLESTILEHSPALWIHGHMHTSLDYKVGDTRIVCNPRGYPDERNQDFDDKFVAELGSV